MENKKNLDNWISQILSNEKASVIGEIIDLESSSRGLGKSFSNLVKDYSESHPERLEDIEKLKQLQNRYSDYKKKVILCRKFLNYNWLGISEEQAWRNLAYFEKKEGSPLKEMIQFLRDYYLDYSFRLMHPILAKAEIEKIKDELTELTHLISTYFSIYIPREEQRKKIKEAENKKGIIIISYLLNPEHTDEDKKRFLFNKNVDYNDLRQYITSYMLSGNSTKDQISYLDQLEKSYSEAVKAQNREVRAKAERMRRTSIDLASLPNSASLIKKYLEGEYSSKKRFSIETGISTYELDKALSILKEYDPRLYQEYIKKSEENRIKTYYDLVKRIKTLSSQIGGEITLPDGSTRVFDILDGYIALKGLPLETAIRIAGKSSNQPLKRKTISFLSEMKPEKMPNPMKGIRIIGGVTIPEEIINGAKCVLKSIGAPQKEPPLALAIKRILSGEIPNPSGSKTSKK